MGAALIFPSLEYERSYGGYICELEEEERYPFPLDFPHVDFPALLRRLENLRLGCDISDGAVPSSTFWLVEAGKLLGVSNLRHQLNEKLLHCGGHIGLGVRPSMRGRGLGSELLRLTIQEAKKRGIGEIHIHCYKDKKPSSRIILANGGVLASEIIEGGSTRVIEKYVVSGT